MHPVLKGEVEEAKDIEAGEERRESHDDEEISGTLGVKEVRLHWRTSVEVVKLLLGLALGFGNITLAVSWVHLEVATPASVFASLN